jgi:hypothetical protein
MFCLQSRSNENYVATSSERDFCFIFWLPLTASFDIAKILILKIVCEIKNCNPLNKIFKPDQIYLYFEIIYICFTSIELFSFVIIILLDGMKPRVNRFASQTWGGMTVIYWCLITFAWGFFIFRKYTLPLWSIHSFAFWRSVFKNRQ